MALSPRQRRELLARAHSLSPIVTVAADRLVPGVIDHVRTCLAQHELAKVRIRAADRQACEQVAAELARLVPCELVARVGRVVVLYRPAQNDTDG